MKAIPKFIIEPINESECRIVGVENRDELPPVISSGRTKARTGATLVIPSEVEHEGKTYRVTQIGEDLNIGNDTTFKDWHLLSKVVIPEGVTKIGMCAFENCRTLKEVVFPSTLVEISHGAFRNCAIEHLELPDSLAELGTDAFLDNEYLESVSLPNNIGKIGVNVFNNSNLKEPVISNGTLIYVPDRAANRMRRECGRLIRRNLLDLDSQDDFENLRTEYTVPECITKISEFFCKKYLKVYS